VITDSSDRHSVLRRYEGWYLTAEGWNDGKHTQQFWNVLVAGDHLAVQRQARNQLHGEEEPGESYPLVAVSEHTFDAVGDPHRFRFVLGDAGVVRSVVVIRDGVPSEPRPRFIPLPQEIAGRRQRFEALDLGHPGLCMTAQDTEAVTRFYERLGFVRDPELPGMVRQGWNVIAFFDFQPQPCINFRGPSVLATGFELAKRGYSLKHGFASITHIRDDEAGGFFVYDPDGHRIFFNTHAGERLGYEAWKNGTMEPGASNHHERNTMDAPVSLPLGDLVVCLDVTDLDASVRFYRGMGHEIIDQTPVSATLFTRPARENRYSFPTRLRQADEPRYSFGFLCADVEGVCALIEERGIEIITTSDGPAFVDPDGNRVTLFPALP
jgi:catechol 2,3-dioxygenase-like lactoylglutathione lyase family enzyme